MSNAQARVLDSGEILLTVISGPENGVAYKLLGQAVSLGRDPQNDVVLQDNKSSRLHAVIERRGGDYWIKDLGSKSGILINGEAVKESILSPGDQISLGGTLLRYGAPPALSLMSAAPPIPQASWLPPLPKAGAISSRTQAPNPKMILAIVLIIGGVIFALSKSGGSKKNLAFKDASAFDEEIESLGQANEKRYEEIMRKGKDTQQYSEAQAFYLRGFREYREGNFIRAMQNFQASLALYPNHPLAKKYLERSKIKNDEVVTTALERAEKAFELEKYGVAYNDYRTVILLTQDPKNQKYQLAKKRMDAINLILMNSK